MLKDTVGIPGVDPKTTLDLHQERENLVARIQEVVPGMAEIPVVVRDHVIDTLEGPVQTVVKKLEIEEPIEDLTQGLGHALVIEEEFTDHVHVPENVIAE